MKHYYPDITRFRKLASRGNVIPICRQLLADALTPVMAYQRLAMPAGGQRSAHSFLLESVISEEKLGRFSYIAVDPVATFTARRDETTIIRDGAEKTVTTHDPLAELAGMLDGYRHVDIEGLPPFTGGLVGYAGYDLIRYYEALGEGPEDDRNLPDLAFGLYPTVVVFDHFSKTVKVISSALVDDDPDSAYDQAVTAIDCTVDRMRTGGEHAVGEVTLVGLAEKSFESNFTRARYMEVVEACKEYIRAGDIFQVVPSQRLSMETSASPLEIYRALRVVNPSPFMFLLDIPEVTLVGSSPEILCRVADGVVTSRPLAGTRRRGASDEEDATLQAELLADPKERAEHIMLVDLARNDVGRVAVPKSIELSELMTVEKYSHVMHIVSNVIGRLAEGMTAFDALRAVLPVGTVSGAPKIRAMEIIDEFEPTRRGPYAGAVGYVDFSGNMNTCIALRTMVIAGGKAYVQAGGGIVADSVAETEYQETINKAKALLRAVAVAENGFED